MQRSQPITDNFQLIIMSDLQPWMGYTTASTTYSSLIQVFQNRVPVVGAMERYALENTFLDLNQRYKIRIQIVYVGLFYGGDGYDFNALFR